MDAAVHILSVEDCIFEPQVLMNVSKEIAGA